MATSMDFRGHRNRRWTTTARTNRLEGGDALNYLLEEALKVTI